MASLQLSDAKERLVAATENGTYVKDPVVNGIDHSDENAVNDEDWVYPHPTDFQIVERPIDQVRELRVAVIGAGLSGITAGILLPQKVPGIKLTIFEKNADVGGTWFENIYPGIRCDIPAHVYQSTFAPNTQWSEEYAQGPEIKAYWQNLAKQYDVYSKLRLKTKILGAYWEPADAQWRLEIESLSTGEKTTEKFDFLITALGRFNEWRLPNYPGVEKYKGKLMHSSGWDPSFDPRGKRIATIGNGASGIQVTTEIRKVAAHVDHYARSRTWIAGSFAPGSKDRQDTPMEITEEQRAKFQDPKVYLEYRKSIEDPLWRAFGGQIADSKESKASRAKFIDLMRNRLEDPSLLDKLVPDFPPNCRRLTPGPGYLEALFKDNVTFIQDPIEEFTETGIIAADGVERQVDAVICSTGANTDLAPPFSIVAGEYDLRRDWRPEGKFGFPYTYLGVSTPSFPNLAFVMGPHPAGPSGTVPHATENQVTYVAKMLRKLSSQHIRSMVPLKEAADDFVEYSDAFFPRTNLGKKCSSWSNGGVAGQRIHGHWPGSAAHKTLMQREPRWEDYEYTYFESEGENGTKKKNRFAYFGNGWTKRELDDNSDMTNYLRLPEDNDLRAIHERWWEV